MTRPAALALVLALFLATPATGQKISLDEMRKALQRLDYVAVDTLGDRLLQTSRLSPAQLLEIHQILGIVAFTEGRPVEARQHFELALSIDPRMELDSLSVSPKIIRFFEGVRSEFRRGGDADQKLHYRYLLLPDRRPAAALRSLILPGLGQFYKGHTKRGIAFLIGGGSGLIATVAFSIARSQARDDYLAETDVDAIPRRYDRFNRLHKRRTIAALATATIWAASFLDALLTPVDPERLAISLQIAPLPDNPSAAVVASVPF